jgi:c-di-GMP-binding flagellar brake protein YcgR
MQPATSLDKTISSELEMLSSEDLIACARLLALSVAEHRAKFGVVPLNGAEALWKGLPREARGLPRDARMALAEAVQMVRKRQASLRDKPSAATAGTKPASEKRRQLRISIAAPVEVADPEDAWRHRGTLRNISWGGAGVTIPGASLKSGDRVRLSLPAARGAKIPILATVLRSVPHEDGSLEYGLRFDSLSPEDEERLQQVLEILLNSPQNDRRRSEARLVHRLEVEYGDAGEFRATLEDISSNGLMLTVLDPLELNQSLLISLSCADTPLTLALRARVLHQTAIEEGGMTIYRVGLQFEHPTEQLRERVCLVLQELALLRPSLEAEQDWISADALL